MEEKNSGIFYDVIRLSNNDEISVYASTRRPIKVCSGIGTSHGRYLALNSNFSKHVTAVVTFSASGLRTPPIFIVSNVNIMQSWFRSLIRQQWAMIIRCIRSRRLTELLNTR